jgi:MFS family permease
MTQPAPAEGARGASGSLGWYLTVQASWFLGLGMQMVLFPYLVADRLAMPPQYLGIAQMCLMGPALIFMLFGGAVADRSDGRGALTRLHALAALPALALAGTIAAGYLRYEWLILYALAMGTIGAFANPARDAILNRVASTVRQLTIQRAVAFATMAQFVAQMAGFLAAAAAAVIGVTPVLLAQGLALMAGAAAARGLPRRPAEDKTGLATGLRASLHEIAEGLRHVRRSPVLAPLIGIMFAVGVLYIGAFMVVLPILIRDVHGGGADRFAMISLSFWGGTIISAMAILRARFIERAGRAILIAMTSGAIMLAMMSMDVVFWQLCVLCFLWGLGGGVAMTLSRATVQELAPEAFRGRILALYSLGFMGGAPIGALTMGFVVAAVGPHTAVLIPSAIMLLVLLLLRFRSELWQVRASRHT